jgi:hypothetical protein
LRPEKNGKTAITLGKRHGEETTGALHKDGARDRV